MDRQSTKGKKIHNRYRASGDVLVTRLQIGVSKNLNDFLGDMSEKTQLAKSEYVRTKLIMSKDYEEWNN